MDDYREYYQLLWEGHHPRLGAYHADEVPPDVRADMHAEEPLW